MSRYLIPGALLLSLLSLLALPAQAGMANATMQVGFVLTEACTVSAARSDAPQVSCSHDSPYRLGRMDAGVQQNPQAAGAWTVYF